MSHFAVPLPTGARVPRPSIRSLCVVLYEHMGGGARERRGQALGLLLTRLALCWAKHSLEPPQRQDALSASRWGE